WPRDWNYVLPAMADPTGTYQPCSGTIVFNLPQVPAEAVQASLYLALAGNNGDKVVISVNDANLGATLAGFAPAYSDTSSIHFSDHGPFDDERITFPATLLHAGKNTLTITMDSRKLVSFLMVDH